MFASSASGRDPASLASNPFAARVARLLPDWHDVSWVTETASTNADLQRATRAALADWRGPLLRGADLQTAGRGRAGRPWRTQAGDALLFSCALNTRLPPAQLPPLSVVAGVAACEALNRFLPAAAQPVTVKWPNDLQWGSAKLAGILPETVSLPAGLRTAPHQIGLVLGIGVNLRGGAALSTHLGRAVADWSMTGGRADPADLVAAIAEAWRTAIDVYAAEGFAPFVARFACHDALGGHTVRVLDGDRVLFEGIASGVDATGRLQVSTTDGLRAVTVGDVSVRSA
jgi:BirA family biotin operon repressor/biotin-[acetyl-CoA-carboxylase] ligase